MRMRRTLSGSLAIALLGVAAWFGWRWHTTPSVPEITIDRTDKALVALVEQAEAEVRRAPRSGAAWGKLGMILVANFIDEPAVPCFVNAERFDPHDLRWPYFHAERLFAAGRPQEAIPLLRRALVLAETPYRRVTPYQRGTILFRLALALIEAGQLDDAEPQLQALQGIDGDSPRVHLGFGLFAIARADQALARDHLTALAKTTFARKTAFTLLATVAGDDHSLALRYQEQANQLPADLPWADPLQAELVRYGVNRPARLRDVYGLLSQGEVARAQDLARQLVAEWPDAENYLLLAHILMQLHQLDEAEQVTRTVIRMDPRNGTAQLALGQMLLQKADKQSRAPAGKAEALELYRQALEAEDQALALGSDHPNAHIARGRALSHLGRTAEALHALRTGVLHSPGSADTQLALGEALAEAGQLGEALEHLEDAVRLASPNDPRPQTALDKWRASGNTTQEIRNQSKIQNPKWPPR